MWENKVFLQKPVLVRGDGPIMQMRRWLAQFYPPAGKAKVEVSLPAKAEVSVPAAAAPASVLPHSPLAPPAPAAAPTEPAPAVPPAAHAAAAAAPVLPPVAAYAGPGLGQQVPQAGACATVGTLRERRTLSTAIVADKYASAFSTLNGDW